MPDILLVDDELISLEGVQSALDWLKLGITNVYTALSMRKAQELFVDHPVDIMLCDIEMPNGSGIDLLRWVREHYPNTVCVFLTCHAHFDYAKEAVKLGAFDYLLKPTPYDELEQVLHKAVTECNRLQSINQMILDLCAPDEKDGHNPKAIDLIKTFILKNLSQDLTREEISQHVFMHPDSLSHLFKRELSMSLSEYILKQRITVAKKLLKETDYPISLIAGKVGYAHISYFTKIFKRETGVTPLNYRKK